jgi:hypothetical protein
MATYETKWKNGKPIEDYLAIGYAEGFEEPSDESDIIRAWSYLIGTRLAYSLQGSFGRQAQSLINSRLIDSTGKVNWAKVNEQKTNTDKLEKLIESIVTKVLKENNPIDNNQKKIAIDTIKNPLKGRFLGGPTVEEAEEILMTKFHFTKKQIEALKTESVKKSIKEDFKSDSIKIDNVKHFLNSNPTVTFSNSYGNGISRQFNISVFDKIFTVLYNSKIVYKGNDLDKAVDAYNTELSEGTWEKDEKAPVYTNRDESRVFDIIEKSKGSMTKKMQLTQMMANAITNIQKAIGRAKSALEFGEQEMYKVFLKRAIDLGYQPTR